MENKLPVWIQPQSHDKPGREYTLYVTYKCNWHCDYCSEDTHNREDVSLQDIDDKIDMITPGSFVSITGGEPGVLKHNVLVHIFDRLKAKQCSINVNTNGTFFKKHKELCHIPDSFLYHCTEHLEEENIYIPDFVDQSKIDFQIVITDDNYSRLGYYIEKYPEIKFVVFGADHIQFGKYRGSTSLSRTNRFRVFKEWRDRIHPNSYLYLIATSREANIINDLRALR